MTKMMSWSNGCTYDFREQHPRYRAGEQMRRLVRAREAEAIRQDVQREMPDLTCMEIGCHPRFHDRMWAMNDEYSAPSNEVWRALMENDQGLRFVDFDGKYTCG